MEEGPISQGHEDQSPDHSGHSSSGNDIEEGRGEAYFTSSEEDLAASQPQTLLEQAVAAIYDAATNTKGSLTLLRDAFAQESHDLPFYASSETKRHLWIDRMNMHSGIAVPPESYDEHTPPPVLVVDGVRDSIDWVLGKIQVLIDMTRSTDEITANKNLCGFYQNMSEDLLPRIEESSVIVGTILRRLKTLIVLLRKSGGIPHSVDVDEVRQSQLFTREIIDFEAEAFEQLSQPGNSSEFIQEADSDGTQHAGSEDGEGIPVERPQKGGSEEDRRVVRGPAGCGGRCRD